MVVFDEVDQVDWFAGDRVRYVMTPTETSGGPSLIQQDTTLRIFCFDQPIFQEFTPHYAGSPKGLPKKNHWGFFVFILTDIFHVNLG